MGYALYDDVKLAVVVFRDLVRRKQRDYGDDEE
jgi:hypothetical protein